MTSPNPRPNMMYEWKGHQSPPNGWRYSKETMTKLDAEGRIWYPADKSKRPRLKRYLDEMPGRLLGNVWIDINPINSQAQERLGYPTQKPVALLERIIQASSNEGDVVLDPFCGCGTAIVAAQKLGRRWIGIDITHLSIALQKYRLQDSFGLIEKQDYAVRGEPEDLHDAQQLAHDDRYQFQWWALSLVKARPVGSDSKGVRRGVQLNAPTPTGKKGADRGIDGVITFMDDATKKAKQILAQVKSGKVKVGDVRDLRGTVEREGAAMGVLITLEHPTREMLTEVASAGVYHSPGWDKDYPRLQILTIDFSLWPVALLRQIVAAPALPAELDAGYRVLLDKDGLTATLRPPTATAYVPTPPTLSTYQTLVNDFSDAPCVAKRLWRDGLLPAKWCLDTDMKHTYLRQLLEWRVEMDHGWSVPAYVNHIRQMAPPAGPMRR